MAMLVLHLRFSPTNMHLQATLVGCDDLVEIHQSSRYQHPHLGILAILLLKSENGC